MGSYKMIEEFEAFMNAIEVPLEGRERLRSLPIGRKKEFMENEKQRKVIPEDEGCHKCSCKQYKQKKWYKSTCQTCSHHKADHEVKEDGARRSVKKRTRK